MSLFADIVRWSAAGEKSLITFPMPIIVKMVDGFAGPQLRKMGFRHRGRGCWVRRKKDPILEVIEVRNHAIIVNLAHGVVLPFVPEIRGTRVVAPIKPEKNGSLILLPGFEREDFPDAFSRVQPRPELLADDIRKRVPAWLEIFRESFNSYRGLPSLRDRLTELRREFPERKPREALGHHQYLSLAFIHARLGEWDEAEAVLESTIKHIKALRPHAIRLRKKLAETASLAR